MASIEKRVRNGTVSYRVRYRDPTGRQRVKTFRHKVDAEKYLALIEAAKLRGTWTDPAPARSPWPSGWRPGGGAPPTCDPRRWRGIVPTSTPSCCRASAPPRWPRSPNPRYKPGSPS
jgi:hypothetical protein